MAGLGTTTVTSEINAYLRKHGFPRKRETTLALLQRRELCSNGRAHSITERIGFAPDAITKYSRWDGFHHDGCINTANWSEDGMFLVTAADDRIVKVWREGCFAHEEVNVAEAPPPLYEAYTPHQANIFCAKFQPGCGNRVVYSCSADGTLARNDLDSHSTSVLVSPYDTVDLFTSCMLHMFEFDRNNPNVMFLAFEDGTITILDTRVRADADMRIPRLRIGSPVKYICQFPPHIGEHRLAVGAMQPAIVQLDVRAVRGGEPANLERLYLPKKLEHAPHARNLSVSGLAFSSDGSKLLASYQGDQIYEFLTRADYSGIYVDAFRSFGGHVNYETFLKNVSYFGPNDEYVVSGSDGGAAMVWDTSDRSLVVAYQADSRICNGVVPHPFYPMFVTYGIDPTATAWWFKQSLDDLPEEDQDTKLSLYLHPADVTERTVTETHEWLAAACHHLMCGSHDSHLPAMYDIENYARNAQHIRRQYSLMQASYTNERYHFFRPDERDVFAMDGFPYYPIDYEGTDFAHVARLCKECGSIHFKAGRYKHALVQYFRAIGYAQYAIYALGKKKLDQCMCKDMMDDDATFDKLMLLGFDEPPELPPNYDAAVACNTTTCPVPWDFRNGVFQVLRAKLHQCFDDCFCEGPCGCESLKQEVTAIRLNICATHLALKDYHTALYQATAILMKSPQETKAYFRRGCAHFELGDYDAALEDFNAALELAPNDAGIQRKIAQVRRANAQRTQKQARAMARMFSSSDDQA